MKQTKVTVILVNRIEKTKTPHEIDGYAVEECPGLAVHRSVYFSYDEQIKIQEHSWKVTHMASGASVASGFDVRAQGLDFCQRVQSLTDWTQKEPKDVVRVLKERGHKAQDVRDAEKLARLS